MAAAVGSLMMRITSSPAMNPASLVAWSTHCQVKCLGSGFVMRIPQSGSEATTLGLQGSLIRAITLLIEADPGHVADLCMHAHH